MPNCTQEERAEGETYQERLTDKGESTNIGDHIFEVFIYIYIFIYLFNYMKIYMPQKNGVKTIEPSMKPVSQCISR